jgi:hypothetical protein
MQIVLNLPRAERTHLRNRVVSGELPLLLVGPKHIPNGYAGKVGYFYCTVVRGKMVGVSKNPVTTRDAGRGEEAKHRFGRPASEYRPKVQNKAKACKQADAA